MKISELKRRVGTDEDSPEVEAKNAAEEEAWWADLLVFLLVGGGTIWLYHDVNAFEAGEGSLHWGVRFVYDLIGKWGLLALPAFIALAKLGFGIAKLLGTLWSSHRHP